MFMDAVGSTSAGEQTDPESLRRVMTRYFDEIRTVVEHHGGTVEKYIGDAVMAVFGVPVVHEDDALRAVRAATEIRERLVTVSAELGHQVGSAISWRTGINTGEVVAGDAGAGQRFVSGDAVNTAARLEQSAKAGEILIGEQTLHLVRDAIVAEPVEPVAAKGKANPLVAHRLIGLTGSSSHAGRRLDAPMIGRQRQRRLLSEAFEQAVDDRVCHLFTILGAAGVGKSRLVAEFLGQVGDDAQILRGRCLSYGEGITYWPILLAIRDTAGIAEDDGDGVVREKLGALVDDERDRPVVVERIGQLMGRFGGGASREETFWAVRTLLESLARRRPVVLVLDDIHWAEPTLLDLIESLADWIRDAPVLLLCVARRELLEKKPDWGGGKTSATTISLEPLNAGESRELMVNLLGQVEVAADLVDKIGTAAEGNPLFVEEMISMLIDRGYLERRADGWVAATELAEVTVPPTIQALLAARLDGLPRAERTVIERGAVEGQVFHRSAVAELAPADLRETLPEHLRALSRKELVRPDRSDFADDEAFRFRHLLIRDAAYAAMPKEARADLHARFAQWLERAAGEHVSEYDEILGFHYEQAFRYRAELGRVDEDARGFAVSAARHLDAAGHRAADRSDLQGAVKLLSTALEVSPAGWEGRPMLVAHYADVLNTIGDVRAAEALASAEMEASLKGGNELGAAAIEIVRLFSLTTLGRMTIADIIARTNELLPILESSGDEWLLLQATSMLGTHNFFAGHALAAHEIFTAGVNRYPPGKAPAFLVGWTLSSMFFGPTPVDEALERARSLDYSADRSLESVAMRITGGLLGLTGEFDEARQRLLRSREIDRELGRRGRVESLDGHFLGPMEMDARNFDEAERIMVGAFDSMFSKGDTGFSCTVSANLAQLYLRQDRFADAERWARTTLEIAQPDDMDAQSRGSSALARVLARQGDDEQALQLAMAAVRSTADTDYLANRATVQFDLGEVHLAAGRHDEAIGAMRNALASYEAKGATVRAQRVANRLAEIEGSAG